MTKRDETSVESWRPIVSGGTARQALQAVDAIAESIASIDPPPAETSGPTVEVFALMIVLRIVGCVNPTVPMLPIPPPRSVPSL